MWFRTDRSEPLAPFCGLFAGRWITDIFMRFLFQIVSRRTSQVAAHEFLHEAIDLMMKLASKIELYFYYFFTLLLPTFVELPSKSNVWYSRLGSISYT